MWACRWQVVELPGTNPEHAFIRDLLIVLLRPIVRHRRLGHLMGGQEYDFAGNVHGPDISFFGLEKVGLLNLNKRVQMFVPDLLIEIAAPADTLEDLARKMERYLRSGALEVWMISPEDRLGYVYSDERKLILSGTDHLSTPLIPGFTIAVEDLFDQSWGWALNP
jgi:Uma2 family endonuclease